MVRGLIAQILLALSLAAASPSPGPPAPAQAGADPYEALTAVQRRLLTGAARARDAYNGSPEPFRRAFEAVTARLATLLLSDPENGEVLGSALDLVESIDPAGGQPGSGNAGSELRLSVALASGARDRLRRAQEFERVDAAGRLSFVHGGPPAVRIEIGERPMVATVIVMQP